jgi:hypothetical protein
MRPLGWLFALALMLAAASTKTRRHPAFNSDSTPKPRRIRRPMSAWVIWTATATSTSSSPKAGTIYVDKVLLNDGKGHFVTSDLGTAPIAPTPQQLADLDSDGSRRRHQQQQLIKSLLQRRRPVLIGGHGAFRVVDGNAAIADMNGDGGLTSSQPIDQDPAIVFERRARKLSNPCIPIPPNQRRRS